MGLNKNEVVLLLGTNLGDRIGNLNEAKQKIEEDIGPILKYSGIYESAPWGYKSINKFLNQVLIIEFKSTPFQLLTLTKHIENDLGKLSDSNIKYDDRPIDIDILFFGNHIISTDTLKIPHVEIQNRRFTLVPLCELLRTYHHPVLKCSLYALLKKCRDKIEPYRIGSGNLDKD